MEIFPSLLQGFFLIPVVAGSVYGFLCLLAVRRFMGRGPSPGSPSFSRWPPVTVLKPVCGPEKKQEVNLRSACLQDYPEFQVVFSVQDPEDPSLRILEKIQKDYPERVSVVVDDQKAGPNGKINNLLGALSRARHDTLVISDSDVHLEPDYLKTIVAPLADPGVGFVCTLYRATSAERWFEKMELLTLNADFVPSVVFAHVSGASKFCLGSSVAFRRSSLQDMGGLKALADYLAEDYEMGKRICSSGKKMMLAPYFVDLTIDLKDFSQWWNHQVTWDQKTCAANPTGFFATVVIRSVPFALFFAASRLGDALGLAVLGGALALRLAAAGAILGWGVKDREGLKALALLPVRDAAALASWVLALTKKTVTWRGSTLILTREGRLAGRKDFR